MKVLFWDIDGTLIRTAKAGLVAFQQATEELLGRTPDFSGISTAGMTDCHIASQILLSATGRDPSPQEVNGLIDRYLELLCQHLALRPGFVLPSAREILSRVHEDPEYISLLLTGNTLAGARTKMAHFRLDHYFDFTISAFGDTCVNRIDIARQAAENIRRSFPAVDPRQIFVIGDTPNDILCGQAIGACTVAVATGTFSRQELLGYNPWWAVDQLPPPAEFLRKLREI